MADLWVLVHLYFYLFIYLAVWTDGHLLRPLPCDLVVLYFVYYYDIFLFSDIVFLFMSCLPQTPKALPFD